MAKILDKLYNRVIDGEILEISDAEVQNLGLAKASQVPALSDAINLGTINVEVDDTDIEHILYYAFFSKSLTKAQYDAIKSDGLVILMFNTTCVIFPFAKAQDNRFTVNAIYNADGESMVVRAKLSITAPVADSNGSLDIDFDSSFAFHLSEEPTLRPYGIVKFLSF